MTETSPQLVLRIQASSNLDDQTQLEMMSRLRKELLTDGNVLSVEGKLMSTPPQSKAANYDWQTLIVTLAASGGVITSIIGCIQSFLTRQEKTSITVEAAGEKLTITGASTDSENAVVKAWLRRQMGKS